MGEIDLSFIIVNWNTRELLLLCLRAIQETTAGELTHEIIVVDNGSTDGSIDAVKDCFPAVRCIVNQENRGFAAANNQAFAVMKGRYALLLNTDATVLHGAVRRLFDFMESHPDAGMACGQLLNVDSTKQNSFAQFPSLLSSTLNESLLRILFPGNFPSKNKAYKQPIDVDSCIGACMIVRKKTMDQVGFFDERYFFFFEETDWARQFWQNGWRVCFVPDALIVHAQGQSAGNSALSRQLFHYSRYQYLRKWHIGSFGYLKAILMMRLCADTLFSGIAVLLTAGLNLNLRRRFIRYVQILSWHLQGCPFPINKSPGKISHARPA